MFGIDQRKVIHMEKNKLNYSYILMGSRLAISPEEGALRAIVSISLKVSANSSSSQKKHIGS